MIIKVSLNFLNFWMEGVEDLNTVPSASKDKKNNSMFLGCFLSLVLISGCGPPVSPYIRPRAGPPLPEESEEASTSLLVPPCRNISIFKVDTSLRK